MRTTTRRRTDRLATLLAVPAILLVLSACATGASGGDASSEPPASRDSWQLAFNQCLRDNGVDVPDDANAPGNANLPNAPGDVLDACTAKVGNPPPLSSDEQAKINDQMEQMLLKMATCYRENGIDVPDPVKGQPLSIPKDAPQNVIQQCGGGMAPGGLVGP